jgi:hypothetical protein
MSPESILNLRQIADALIEEQVGPDMSPGGRSTFT